MTIAPATDLVTVRELFLEYAVSLGVDLSFQDFDAELADLENHYEAIWTADGDAACVALRRIDRETCEMKRLYVRPHHRGHGLGRLLAQHAIDEARRRGYSAIRLDTLPFMREAMALYEDLGFQQITAYRFNPVAGSRYYELKL